MLSDSENEAEEVKKEESQPKKSFFGNLFGGFGKSKEKVEKK